MFSSDETFVWCLASKKQYQHNVQLMFDIQRRMMAQLMLVFSWWQH